MKKILITGTNGYIGKNLLTYLQKYDDYDLIPINRDILDLTDTIKTKEFINHHQPDTVIHCAIKGGRRNVIDSPDIVYYNLKMFNNLYECRHIYNKFINIGSGAAYDNALKQQPYGISKYFISQICNNTNSFYNIDVWGLFSANENNDRFIKANLLRYINKEPMVIYKNKKMDFYYMDDFISMMRLYLNDFLMPKEMPAIYNKTYTLLDIANYINTLNNYKVDIIIENSGIENYYYNYNDRSITHLMDNYIIGLFKGIELTYNKLLNESK